MCTTWFGYPPHLCVLDTFVGARDKHGWELLWNSAVLLRGHLQAPGIVLTIAFFVVWCSEGLFHSEEKQEVALKYQFQHKDLQFAVLSQLCAGKTIPSPPPHLLSQLNCHIVKYLFEKLSSCPSIFSWTLLDSFHYLFSSHSPVTFHSPSHSPVYQYSISRLHLGSWDFFLGGGGLQKKKKLGEMWNTCNTFLSNTEPSFCFKNRKCIIHIFVSISNCIILHIYELQSIKV